MRRKPHARHATRQRRRREGRAASRRSGRSSRPGFNSGVGRRGRGDPRADADADAVVGIVVVVSELVPKLGRRRFVKIVKPDPHVGIRPNPRAARQSRASVVTPHDAEHRRDLRRVAARDRRHRDGVQSGAIARASRQLARRVCSRFFRFFFYFYLRASLSRRRPPRASNAQPRSPRFRRPPTIANGFGPPWNRTRDRRTCSRTPPRTSPR